MALEISIVPKPVVTRRRSDAAPFYGPEDAQTVVDALAQAEEGYVVAFDAPVETATKARQRAASMVDAIVDLGHPKLSTRVITEIEAIYTEPKNEGDKVKLKTPGVYRAAIINRPARQRTSKA